MLQAEQRFRKRVPCTLKASGRAHSGMVLNLSRGGLFVQTSAHVAPGEDVSLELNVPTGRSSIPLGARVVWRRVVATHLRSVSHGGFGVRIQQAPEDYYRFLSGMMNGSSGPQPPVAAAPAPDGPPGALYRVRLKQTSGPRTRWLSVRSSSAAAAGAQALAEAGSDWHVLATECAE